MTDKALRQAIIDELAYEPSVVAEHVGVTVENGVVTLLGHVGSYPERCGAENAAARVHGVRGVANELQVKLSNDRKQSDESIAQRAVQVLRWDVAIPPEEVQVHVARGIVTLTGQVDWGYQRRLAEDDVRRLHGVVMVRNQVTVKQRPDAAIVRQKITDALKRNLADITAHISVATHGSVVELSGKVADVHQRQLAEQAAWAAPGVTHVDDHLVVI